MKPTTIAPFILLLVTMIWGLTFPLLHEVVNQVDPALFVFSRLAIASLVFLPFVIKRLKHASPWLLWGGFMLAVLDSATYIFQTQGLQTISSSRSAFITGTAVLLVPMLAPLFKLRKPKPIEIVAALLCACGLYILTGANFRGLGMGDLWTLGCALSYALMVLTLQVVTKRVTDNLLLTFYTLTFAIVMPLPFVHTYDWHTLASTSVILPLLYCAVLSSSLVVYLMIRYQRYVSVTRATLIYTMEPVFATTFAFFS